MNENELRIDAAEQLLSISEEIAKLVDEAIELVRAVDPKEARRAESYWHSQILSALGAGEPERGAVTLENTISSLRWGDDGEERKEIANEIRDWMRGGALSATEGQSLLQDLEDGAPVSDILEELLQLTRNF